MWMPRNTRPRLVDGTDHWWRGGSKLPFTGGASANHISGASWQNFCISGVLYKTEGFINSSRGPFTSNLLSDLWEPVGLAICESKIQKSRKTTSDWPSLMGSQQWLKIDDGWLLFKSVEKVPILDHFCRLLVNDLPFLSFWIEKNLMTIAILAGSEYPAIRRVAN